MGRNKTYGIRTTNKLKKDLMICLDKTNGQIYKALKMLEIQPTIYYNWKRDDITYDVEISEKLSALKELRVDEAEDQLLKNIQMGNQRAVEYYLNNHGKNRGYSNIQEKEVVMNQALKLNLIVPEGCDPEQWKNF